MRIYKILILLMTMWAVSAVWAEQQDPMRIRIQDEGNTVEVRDAATDGIIREFHLAEVFQTALNASIKDGDLYVQCGDGQTRIYSITTGSLIKTIPTPEE